MDQHTASVPIEIRGRYFWRGDERFLIRGVVYQEYSHQTFQTSPNIPANDEISDDRLEQLEHDIGLFKELGINAIFVCSCEKLCSFLKPADLLVDTINNAKCHDKAMKMLEEAGIYVLASVSTVYRSINRMAPLDSYNAENVLHFFKTADVLASYPNCLGLLASHEVINNNSSFCAAPVIRAVVRDLKRYLRLKHEVTGQRILPVGYSAADVRMLEKPTREYLTAGHEGSRIEFWAKNDYSWASPSNMQISGYNNQLEQYGDFNIPAFFSEYGANTNAPRDFGETAAMLSPKMTHIFSGGFAYEFWRAANGYGMVKRVKGNEAARWRRAHHVLKSISVKSISEDMAKMTLADYVESKDGDGRDYEDDRGVSRRLDRNIAEYRETSIGEIVLFKDFMNLKERLDATMDVPANTDPEWVDSAVTASRASDFPTLSARSGIPGVGGEESVPPTCIDWQRLEETIRDGEYVLVSGQEDQQ